MRARFAARQTAAARISRRGGVMVFMVAGIVLLLAMVMFSVDVATMHLVRAELRVCTDAAAKAGAEALLRTQTETGAIDAAVAFAALNNVGGKPFKIATKDVVVGTSKLLEDGSWSFAAGGQRLNSVRINSLMSASSASGPVTLAFGKVFGSGTFTPAKTSTASALEQEICLVLDRSGSMAYNQLGIEGLYPLGGSKNVRPKAGSRWDSLLTAVGIYLDEVEETPVPSRLALVTWASYAATDPGQTRAKKDAFDIKYTGKRKFQDTAENETGTNLPSTTASLDVPLGYDIDRIVKSLTQRTAFPIQGRTNMSAGIGEGLKVLTSASVRPFAAKVMILMTDGQWNEGSDPIAAARTARDKGIQIHVVTFLSEAKSADAQQVAKTTGGLYFHANDEAELTSAFQKLARTLPVVLTE